MAELKTRPTTDDPAAFLAAIDDPQRRADALEVATLMARVSGEPARMWGPSIVGFGSYRYRYDSGRSGEWMRIGLSPRKAGLSLYIMPGFDDYETLLARLGKHATGKSCLVVKRLSDIDPTVLRELIEACWLEMARRYPI